MKKAALHNLGCKVNSYEAEAMQQALLDAGYQIVPFHEKADVYIINTCSVTNTADKKSRQMIHRAKKNNPESIVVAAGCYVQVSQEKAETDSAIDIIVGNNRKQDLIQLIEEFESGREVTDNLIDISDNSQPYEELKVIRPAEHTRAFLKIQDGCNQFCSYCIIPYARGRVRSRKPADVLEETLALAENGFQEIVLTGIHLSSYGIDIGTSLLELIRDLHEVEGIKRIRLGSLEPRFITEQFVQELKSLDKVCPHFHLSLQSGSDTVLKRMNRKYTTEEYFEKCDILRKHYEHPAITTDIIVGFPCETEEEFIETCKFAEQVSFYEIHVFKYSKRDGTVAAKMPGQIPESVKNRRSNILIEQAEHQKQEFIEWYKGKKVQVLFEEKAVCGSKEVYEGFTPEYVKVAAESDANLRNHIIEVEFLPHLY